jgi:hypothetical protein
MATSNPISPPSLDELTSRFLATRAARTADPIEPEGDVVPHEVAGGFRAPTRLTWDEALAVFRVFDVEAERMVSPPEWAAFINLDLPAVGLPLAAGVFPQRFRQVPGSLAVGDLSSMLPSAPGEAIPQFQGLRGWIRKTLRSNSPTALLVASGIAATLGDWADADEALNLVDSCQEEKWRTVCENQHAALLWLRGRHDEALSTWKAQHDQPAIAFNRGMASLFMGKMASAVPSLETANGRLPDSTGWCHLARLYLSLAQSRVK